MSPVEFVPEPAARRRISLAHIDAVVAARLGSTRGLGKSQPAAFNRQVAMYLAKQVGRWTTTVIGRFYNGRDHSTVCHAIYKIADLSKSNPEIEALVAELKGLILAVPDKGSAAQRSSFVPPLRAVLSQQELELLADQLAERVYGRIRDRLDALPQDQPQAHS
ncbi:MAG TPA: helix-turn-helix domain-containing protein [Bryobacteraceae bacterium]